MRIERRISAILAAGAGALLTFPAFADTSKMSSEAHDCYVETRAATDLAGGIAACTEALDKDLSPSDRASTYINRAVLRSMSRDFDGALADYTAALQVGEHVSDIYVDRSSVYLSLARFTEAKADADKALSLRTSRPEIAYYNRAVADERLGDIKAAYADTKAALAANPGFTPAIENLKRFKVISKSTT